MDPQVTGGRPRRGGLAQRAREHRRLLGFAGAAAAAVMTAVWLLVVPSKADATTGLQQLVIRWGHPTCWALLAVLGVLVAVDGPTRVRHAVALAAAACYAAFVAAMVL